MKNVVGVLLLAAITILASCGNAEEEKARQKAVSDSLLQVQQDSLLDMFKGELEAISKTVNQVSVRNNLLNTDSAEGEVLSKERIIDQVTQLDQLLAKNQEQLDNLYSRMRENKLKNQELEKLITSMQSRISEREEEIDQLLDMLADKDLVIEDIKSRMDTMRRENIELTEDIIEMDEEMHLVYYVVGDQKELKDRGIVTKEGGLLGIGGAKKLDVSQLDTNLFTKVDQREVKDIPLYVKKAKLITNHPEGSYELKLDDEGGVESLQITNRKLFWKATDYLVIEVDA